MNKRQPPSDINQFFVVPSLTCPLIMVCRAKSVPLLCIEPEHNRFSAMLHPLVYDTFRVEEVEAIEDLIRTLSEDLRRRSFHFIDCSFSIYFPHFSEFADNCPAALLFALK